MRELKNTLILCMGVLFFIACNEEHLNSGDPSVENEVYTNELSVEEATDLLKVYVKELSDSPQTRSTENIKITSVSKDSYSYPAIATRSGFNDGEDIEIPVYNFEIEEGENEGFALLVGDKRFPKILAYAENGSLSDTTFNIGLREWSRQIPNYLLDLYDSSLDGDKIYGLSEGEPINKIESVEDDDVYPYGYELVYKVSDNLYYKFYTALVTVGTTTDKEEKFIRTQWDQLSPFNDKVAYLPSSCNRPNQRGAAGCIPIAAAQIVAHYAPSYRPPSALYKYDWKLLKGYPRILRENYVGNGGINPLSNYDELCKMASFLIKEFHDLTDPIINCGGTSNSTDDLLKILNYMGLYFAYREVTSDEDLLQRVPFILTGLTDDGNGHAYIIDGWRKVDIFIECSLYRTKNSRDGVWGAQIKAIPAIKVNLPDYVYHINWGWAGQSDGWYTSTHGHRYNNEIVQVYNIQR